MRVSRLICTFALFIALAQRPISAAQAIPAVSEKMKEFVAQNEVAGAVTLVGDKEKILYLDVTGKAVLSSETPLSRDALFWFAWMSKPVTGVAVLIMQEEGEVSVEEPVEKYIPEFAN